MKLAHGGKLAKQVSRAGRICTHTLQYSLCKADGQLAGKGLFWSASGSHNADEDCIFLDIELLNKLSHILEADSIKVYQQATNEAETVKSIREGKTRTLDEVIGTKTAI